MRRGRQGKCFLRFQRRRVIPVKDAVALLEELCQLRGNTGIDSGEILIEVFDIGLEIGLLVMRANQAEGALPGGKNVGAAVLIFLQDFHDHRGTPGLRESSFMEKNKAEWGLCIDAAARHQAVPPLKNVQRHCLSREQNHVQRE
jgi:hypothetical protein